mmetsp:Transcript_70016/g.130899  ORF Transcript_70016/g.130899 Transcript_70016/m.130899 type:complete len:147 (-) Transcript_70016:111-551(-)
MPVRLGHLLVVFTASLVDARLQEEATLAKVSLHSLTQLGAAATGAESGEQADPETPSMLLIVGWLLSLVTLVALLWASGRQLLVLKVLLAQERQGKAGERVQGDVEALPEGCKHLTGSSPDEGLEAELGSFFSAVLKERGAVTVLA